MNTFDELCINHNCDKGRLPNGVGHCYGRHYSEVLEPLRHQPIRLLEIGVGDGKSIRVWLDYFTHPQAHITGVDIDPVSVSGPRYTFRQINQTDALGLQSLFGHYDVIIDDGAHTPQATVTSFEALWPFLKSGGYFIIEDLKTSYMSGYQNPGWGTQMSFVKRLLDDINAQTNYKPAPDTVYHYPDGTDGTRGIDWMRFSEELCIIRKR